VIFLDDELIKANYDTLRKRKLSAQKLTQLLAESMAREKQLKDNLCELDKFYPVNADFEVLRTVKKLSSFGSGGSLVTVIDSDWLKKNKKKKGDSITLLAMP